MARIEASVVIGRPIEEVFAFVTDIEKLPRWAAELVEAKVTSQGPVGVGTTWSGVVQFLGRRMENTHQITEFEPNRKFGSETIASPVPLKGEFTFEAVVGGTKVTMVAEVEPGSFFQPAEPVFGRLVQEQYESNLANLKEILEAEPHGDNKLP